MWLTLKDRHSMEKQMRFKSKTNKGAIVLLISFLSVWLILMLVATDFLPNLRLPKGEWLTVTHTKYNFSIQHPDNWSIHKYDDRGYKNAREIKLILNYNARGFNGLFVKIIEDSNPTLEKAANWGDVWLKEISSTGKYREISFTEDNINGQPALRRVSAIGERVFVDTYIARENDFVVITLQTSQTHYNQFSTDYDKVVHSFTTLKSN
ncbi:MAG TPA: hypothetical protein ENJ93_10210 [Chloroflexi bacterium]|nr:hypothetical protein [Chloroflexota bacterium]